MSITEDILELNAPVNIPLAPGPTLPQQVEITIEEKYALRTMESTYLKAQQEFRNLETQAKGHQDTMNKVSKEFPEYVKNLLSKYKVDPEKYVFDNLDFAFKIKQEPIKVSVQGAQQKS